MVSPNFPGLLPPPGSSSAYPFSWSKHRRSCLEQFPKIASDPSQRAPIPIIQLLCCRTVVDLSQSPSCESARCPVNVFAVNQSLVSHQSLVSSVQRLAAGPLHDPGTEDYVWWICMQAQTSHPATSQLILVQIKNSTGFATLCVAKLAFFVFSVFTKPSGRFGVNTWFFVNFSRWIFDFFLN